MKHWSSEGAVAALAVQDEREVITPDQALANAIVAQAALDYINAKIKGDTGMVSSCRRFFESGWYEELTRIPSRYMIDLCDRSADECIRNNVKRFRPYYRRGHGDIG